MKQYLDLLQLILDEGVQRSDRTGTGTLGIFGHQMRFDLGAGFPLLTTKKLFMKGITHELLWFIAGDTNIEYLVKNDVHIWDEWAYEKYKKQVSSPYPMDHFITLVANNHEFAVKYGNLGPVYGAQWRNFGSIPAIAQAMGTEWHQQDAIKGTDQIANLIDGLKRDPYGRRHIVSAWNPRDLAEMALPPCHCLFQFYVANNKLSCQLYQRSCDVFLGVPFNIASYSLLTMMIAQVVGLEPGEFIHTLGDAHLYVNHIEQAKLQLTRTPKALPKLSINPFVKSLFDFKYGDFSMEGYTPDPHIKAPIAV